jgi:hypothetical protein
MFDLVHPDDLARSQQRAAEFDEGDPTYGMVNRWRRPDGGWVRLSWSPVHIDGQWYAHAIEVPDFLSVVTADGHTVSTADLPRRDTGSTTLNETDLDRDRLAELEAENASLWERVAEHDHLVAENAALLAYVTDLEDRLRALHVASDPSRFKRLTDEGAVHIEQ